MSGKNKGYIAIVSALLISFVIMTITLGLSFSVYFGRFNVLSSEAKERSLALAEACAEKALLKFSLDPSYSGNEIIVVSGPETCNILPVTAEGDKRIIMTRGEFYNTVSKIKVVISASPVTLVSWEEVP